MTPGCSRTGMVASMGSAGFDPAAFRAELRRDAYRQSETACCPRETIPDSCSCLEGCECMCLDCDCTGWGEEYDDA
jgi:hypothetical protein